MMTKRDFILRGSCFYAKYNTAGEIGKDGDIGEDGDDFKDREIGRH